MIIASIDVDAQRCFTPLCPEELPVPQGQYISQALNEQAAFASIRIGTKDAHPHDAIWVANTKNPPLTVLNKPNADLYWPRHAVPGTTGFKLIEDLPHPTEYDFFVWKGMEPDMHPYGACYHDLNEKLSTGLIEYLTVKKASKLIVGGLALEFCVKTTAVQLKKVGFDVLINLEATRGLDKLAIQKAIEEMRSMGIYIANTTQEIPEFINPRKKTS